MPQIQPMNYCCVPILIYPLQQGEYGDEFKGKEDEEDLRLTSTDDEDKLKDISDEDYKDTSKNDDNDSVHVDRKIKTEPVEEEKYKEVGSLGHRNRQNGNSKVTDLYGDLPEPVKQELDDEVGSDDKASKSRKKKKKDKKEKKKKKKKDKERDEKDESRKRKRELASQISLAKKIAEKDIRESTSG